MLPVSNPAILFEPEGYVLTGPKLMGRQAAGNAFLRAAVGASKGQELWAYTPHRASAEVFGRLVQAIAPDVTPQWCPAGRLDLLSKIGALYLPGPELSSHASLRLRAGVAAYSLCGVTHTTASHAAMDSITKMLSGAVMPWDALICTSTAVASTVKVVLDAEMAYLRWRFGSEARFVVPQLPVIPLGVHCEDYAFPATEKLAARTALQIAPDEIVMLFTGRLSFHAKAHPHPMYYALQAVAAKTGKNITLIQSGWFYNQHIEQAFKTGAEMICPSVRCLYTEGRNPEETRKSWAAADIFISLSDNMQETFGLTPIEAMAAALPVVVTDWNGYKDTVRDGVDGYRIPTWMSPPPLGEPLARAYEAGVESYDRYCGLGCQAVSVDMQALGERLTELVGNAALRQTMGQSGQARAWEVFDWGVVYGHYQELWQELATIRRSATENAKGIVALAPKTSAARLDPYRTFQHYPTHLIRETTRVMLATATAEDSYCTLISHPLFSYIGAAMPSPEIRGKLFSALGSPLTIQELSQMTEMDIQRTIRWMSVFAKMGIVRFE